jgi:DNA-binding LacI/PurR family transcriptional regulator
MSRRLNIHLFSKQTGYSVATVSRALNPQTAAMVKPETRQKIQELAAKLNFVPHPGARVLRRRRLAPIAVLVREKECLHLSDYYSKLLMGVLAQASKRGQAVHAMSFTPREDNFIDQLNEATVGCDAIIYLSDPLTASMQSQLTDLHRPFISTPSALSSEMEESHSKTPVFGLNELAGGHLIAQHLIDLGHRNIAFIGGPLLNHDAYRRKQGFELAMQQNNIPVHAEWMFECLFDFDSATQLAPKIQSLLGDITAVVCASDEVALGLIHKLSLLGVACPRDISVTGYDDLQWASRSTPTLTTIRQPLMRMASITMKMIDELKDGQSISNQLFDPELMARESTVKILHTNK